MVSKLGAGKLTWHLRQIHFISVITKVAGHHDRPLSPKSSLERVLKIARSWDCERGGADGEARRGRIFERNLQPRSNEASRLAPPQDRPRYFQNMLLACGQKIGTNGAISSNARRALGVTGKPAETPQIPAFARAKSFCSSGRSRAVEALSK
jgi:hypothetical protein